MTEYLLYQPWHICAHLSKSAEERSHQPQHISPAEHLAGFLLRFLACCTHRGADLIAHPEIEAALLIHWVVDAGKFGKLRPVVLEGVIQQTVVRAARKGQWCQRCCHDKRLVILLFLFSCFAVWWHFPVRNKILYSWGEKSVTVSWTQDVCLESARLTCGLSEVLGCWFV